MALSIGELIGTISLNDQFSGPINGVARAVGVTGESFRAVTQFASIAAGAIIGTTGAIVALGIQGGKVETMRQSFESLTGSVGESASAMLGSMTSATQGLVSDMDLMAASNKAVLLGLPVTAESMGTLAQAATVLGRAMGQDAGKSLDDLTTALGRSSPLILDNLGLTVKVGDANEAYARVLGKSADKLTEAEKKTAFYNAAMAAAQQKVAELGGIHLTFADRVQQGQTMVTNFVNSLGRSIATSPVVAAGLDTIMKSLQAAFGGTQQDTVKKLMGYVNDFAIGLTYVAEVGVTAAQVMLTGWYALKVAVLGVVGAIAGVAAGIVSFAGGMAEAGAGIPIVGDKLKGFGELATAMGQNMAELTSGIKAEGEEALRGVQGNSDLHRTLDGLHGGVLNVREAMEKAAAAGGVMAEKTATIKKPAEEVAAAVALTAAELKALADQEALSVQAVVAAETEAAAMRIGLMNSITQLQTSGLEQKLAGIEAARVAEIAGISADVLMYTDAYASLVELTNEKYGLLTAAAQGHYSSVEAAAAAAGFSTTAQLQATADNARTLFDEMTASGKFSYKELEKAHKAWKDAEDGINKTSALTATQQFELIASAAKTFVSAVFGNNKGAAIATAIIDTASAVVKALATPPPMNFPLAAIVGAAGLVQINKIRSTQPAGLATGTPDMSFVDWGRASNVDLHGPEAVINRKQGKSLTEMVEDSLNLRQDRTVEELRAMREDMADDRRRLPLLMRDAALMAGA